MAFSGRFVCLTLILTVPALVGCREEEIRYYRVPKVEAPPALLLGVIAPREGQTWFFKLSGPADLVAAKRQAFDQFVASVTFPGPGSRPIGFTVPDGATEEPGKGFRFATIRLGPGLELIVTPLSGQAGSVLENVNRWRREIGLPPLTEADLKDHVKPIQVADKEAFRVEAEGQIVAGGGMGGPFAR